MTYMVHVNDGGAVFVKEREFFIAQGGEREPWGKAWTPVLANDIEHARQIGRQLHGGKAI